MARLYKHPECLRCVFLGTWECPTQFIDLGVPFKIADLYWCSQGGYPTVIARYSDRPDDYDSGMAFVEEIPALSQARKLAIEKGLV